MSGSLDYCAQSHCAGWAADGDEPVQVVVYVSGQLVGRAVCDVDRPDLEAHGLRRAAGFNFVFPRALRLQDEVDVLLASGARLANSPSIQHRERLERLLVGVGCFERGLELGPLSRPIIDKANYNVVYVDHATTAELRAKYDADKTQKALDREKLVDVDVVWGGQPLVQSVGSGYAYCLASHVIEHVADPIGWLGEIAAVLRPGGRINLAIPERTRTFDWTRQPSTVAQMLDAHRRGLRRPSFAQIYDHVTGVTPLGTEPGPPAELAQAAYAQAIQAEQSGAYMDVHCHVWDAQSFTACWTAIDALGLLPLRLDAITPANGPWNEFTVSLVRT